MSRLKKLFIGDRAFYRAVLMIILPVIVQNGISNFVSLLDNLMVGGMGTNEMSGVSVANQLVFVFNLALFGGLSGPGIFTAQFFGANDTEGVRNTFRVKIWLGLAVAAVSILVFTVFGDSLYQLFLTGEATGEGVDAEKIFQSAREYMQVIVFGLPLWGLSQAYATNLRETGDAFWPMVASVASVLTNLFGNWVLIYGQLGFPALGVQGAAIATVASRGVELLVVVLRTHRHPEKYPFIKGAFRKLTVPVSLLKDICKAGLPLLVNETLWSIGLSVQSMILSASGLEVVGALSISSTISNLFRVVSYSMGTAVSVMVGQSLGANRFEEAKAQEWRLIFFGIVLAIVTGGLLFAFAGLIPEAYTNVLPEVRSLATAMLKISAIMTPIDIFTHCAYFAFRAGGKSMVTFLFDCGFTWVVTVSATYLAVKVLGMSIIPAFALVYATDLLKAGAGYLLLRSEFWVRNIVDNQRSVQA